MKVHKMNKRWWMLLLSAILFTGVFFASCTLQIYAEDGLYENIGDVANESGDENLIKHRNNYEIDSEKISFFKDPGAVMFNMATNFLLSVQKDITKLLIIVFDFAMETNMSTILETFIEPFISGMKDTIFDKFAVIMISICAFWFLLRFVANRQSEVFSNMLSLMAIIVIAFAFYAYPVQLLNGIDAVSNEVADSVMDAPYEAISEEAGSGEISSKGKSSTVIWNLFVHKPWQIIEFGSVEKAQQYEEEILTLTPGSDEREKKVEEISKKESFFSKTMSNQIGRCTTSMILLLINFFLMVIIMLFCVLILGYQFLLLIYMMLGIFVFLLALIPYYGIELVKRWGMKLLSTAAMKVLLVFFLSLLMVFMTVIYGFTDKFGLLCTLIIIVVMTAMLYLKKDELIGLFSEFNLGTANIKTPEQMVNRAMDQDVNAVNKIRSVKDIYQLKNQTGSGNGTDQVDQANHKISSFGVSEPMAQTQIKDLRDSSESISKSVQDMSRYFVKAEDLLQKSYEKSKHEAEDKAMHTNSEVEYGNFVNKTDAVREMGIGKFDSRDLSSVASLIKSVEQKGGDVEKIIDTKSDYLNKPTIARPSELPREYLDANHNQRATAPLRQTDAGKNYFTKTFGDEKGELFYEDMRSKYDDQAVENFSSEEKLTYAQIQRQLKENSRDQFRQYSNGVLPEQMRPQYNGVSSEQIRSQAKEAESGQIQLRETAKETWNTSKPIKELKNNIEQEPQKLRE